MTDENRQENSAAEMARAEEALKAARVLIEAGLLHDAESRLYYAIYHAAMAALLTEGVEPRSHAGVSSLLGLHFVKTGRLAPNDGRLFSRVQKYRQEADYARNFVFTEPSVREDLADCEGFLERVRRILAEPLGPGQN